MVEIGLHLPLATFSDCIPCRGHSARKSTLFGHRCTLVWPPPVRLFALPTNVREASRQHPAGYVDAYAHTHAHADKLWGVQDENAVPLISVLMRTSSNASHTPHTQKHHERHTQKNHERRWAACTTPSPAACTTPVFLANCNLRLFRLRGEPKALSIHSDPYADIVYRLVARG